MSENYFALSRKDRRELLESVSVASGMPSAVLEKDIWIVWWSCSTRLSRIRSYSRAAPP